MLTLRTLTLAWVIIYLLFILFIKSYYYVLKTVDVVIPKSVLLSTETLHILLGNQLK